MGEIGNQEYLCPLTVLTYQLQDITRITCHQIGLGENDNKTWTEILPVWGALKTLLKPIWNCPTSPWKYYITISS